ncbi:hypothetical protein [Ekhidna sp.]|uniref:hypothetical protein n=1 Tax=Ekhidna sp. TaxID=2608089 RepID=UPI003CCB8FFB
MPNRSNFRSKKILIYTGVVTFLVGVGFGVFFIGKYYAADILNEVIKRETKGFYELNFESLDLDLFENRINVKGLRLKADSTKDFASLGLNNIYEIQLDELIIDLESIYALYLEKELIIKSVRVVDPNIDMISLKTDRQTKFSFEAGNMYQAISDYLKVLKIDYFRIQDGELKYDEDQFALGEINFIVKNLLMDSVSRKNQVFYSEQIELEIKNQLFHLPDSIHEISFDRFLLSTSDSILTFENLRVNPKASTGVTFKGNNDFNVYDIHVPTLSLKGIDYVAAYQKNHLIIDELILDEPTVFVDDESHSAGSSRDDKNSLLALIFQIFGSLDVGKLTINDAQVDLKIDGVEKYQRFKVDESNMVFYNIHLDTSNYRFDHRFRYFEDIELDIHNYTYLLPDSVHTAYFELLRISSFDSELRFENLTVSHERAGNEAKVLVDVKLPLFLLKNIDFQRAIADKVLNVGSFKVPNALLEVKNTGSATEKEAMTVQRLYQALAPYFREISIDQLSFDDFELKLPKGIEIDDIDLNVKDFHINKATRNFQRLIQQSDLQVTGFSFDRDSIQVGGSRLSVSESMSSFQLLDWDIAIKKDNQQVNAQFDSLQISGVIIDSLIVGNYTAFTRAMLINPNIEFDIQSKKKSNGFDLGKEKEVIISGGRLRGSLDSMLLSMDGLDADVFIGDSTAFRSAGIENILIRSDKHNHLVNIAKWKYDTLQGQMEFDDLKIEPLDRSDSSIIQLDAAIPFLRLTDFEQAHFFDENHLYANLIHLSNPLIRVKPAAKKDAADSVRGKDSFTMAVQLIRIDTGEVSLNLNQSKSLQSLSISGIDALIYGLEFPLDKAFEKGSFYSDSILFSSKSINPILASGDSVSVGDVQYSSTNKNLELDSVYFLSAFKNIAIKAPSIQFKSFDVQSLYEPGNIHMDSLIIRNPTGYSYPTEPKGEGNPIVTPISIGHVSLDGIDWHFIDSIKHQDYHLQNGSISMDKFLSNDTLDVADLADKVDRLTIEAGPLELPLPDDYTFSLDHYQFDYPENTLALEGLSLQSAYTYEEYSNMISEQSDWFDVAIESVYVYKVDLDALISGTRYATEKVAINGLDALIYRDKGVPFPEDQVKPLPQQSIREMVQLFQVDTINLKGTIRYQEKPENYFTHGEISFDELNAQLVNVGNAEINSNEMMLLSANGKLMGAGRFEVDGAFNMKAPDETFSLNGRVTDFPLDSMNRMLGPVANVNIKSGFAKDLYFNFNANDELARGEMRFRYDDLKVQILNVKTHDTKGFGQGIKTFFANTFVVKSKNPSYLLFLRKGTIFHERDTSRAIFNYWGKALLSGAVSSIGVHKSDKAEKKFERQTE